VYLCAYKKLIYEEKLQTEEELARRCMDGVVLKAHGKQLALFKNGSPVHK
jgi:ribosomal protein S27AE